MAKFENRETYVGGSDYGSVLDINPYKSRFALVLEKANVLKNTFEGNEATRRGELLEDEVIKLFELKTDLKVTDKQKVFEKTISDITPLKMLCHIDGFIRSENSVFEAKTTEAKGKVWDNGIPPAYEAQLEYNCYLSKADKAYIAVAFCEGNNIVDFKWFEYKPKLTEDFILNSMFEFIKDVKEASEKYGVINNGLLVQNNNIDDMVSELEELKQKISETNRSLKPYEDRKKQIEKELKEMIGINSGIESSLYRVVLGNRIYQPSSDYSVSRASLRVEYKEN